VPVKVTPPDAEAFFNQTEAKAPSDADLNGRKPSFDPPSPMDAGGKVAIDVGCDHMPTLTSLCWEAIKRQNKPPIIFRYGSRVVRIMRDANQGIWLQTVTPEVLRNELANMAHWHKWQIKLAKPPLDLMANVLNDREMYLPALRGVVAAPVFAADGTLMLTPGYNEKSGLYYAPQPGFEALPVPDEIEGKHVNEANKLLCGEVLVDFPFASTSDRDNAVGLFLLPYARELVAGITPNHLVESSMNGSGKGKLANALTRPFLGRALGTVADPHDERELAKEITTQLAEGKPIVLFDNFTTLNSPSLAALWTSEIWDKRLLYTQQTANIEIRTVWVMTGKNVQMKTEMARRCVRSRIAPTTDRPEERSGFKHPELETWVAEHRAELVLAAHIIIKWWLQQGRPPAPHGRCLGSFEAWSRVIGGILFAAGYTEFLANYHEFQTKSDSERNARSAFCATWYEWVERERQARFYSSVSELLPLTEGIEGMSIRGNTTRAQTISLGMYLNSNADVHVEHTEEREPGVMQVRQFRIGRGSIKGGKQQWFIEKVSEQFHQDQPETTGANEVPSGSTEE
jgi:hypothetical protein